MKKILYLDNFNNFNVFSEIQEKSKRLNIDFLLFNKEKFNEAKSKDTSCFFIDFKIKNRNPKVLNFIEAEELDVIIANDRLLKYLPKCISKRILGGYLHQIETIIDNGNYDLVVGEISWAVEYIVYKLCESKGLKYRHILNLPLEKVHAVGFDSEHSFSSLCENIAVQSDHKYNISYLSLCQGVKKSSEHGNVKSQYRTTGSTDYREFRPIWIVNSIIAKLNSIIYKSIYSRVASRLMDLDIASRRRVIYFPLHVQPESTPDYVSPFFSNQLGILRKLSQQLSEDDLILVKEHPNKVSPRNITTFISLNFRKNIQFISLNETPQELIKASDIIVTIAGTTCFEAQANNKPSIVLSNIFYSQNDGIYDGRANFTNGTFNQFIDDILTRDIKMKKADYSQYGVCGFLHDPAIFNNVYEPENIAALESLIFHLASEG